MDNISLNSVNSLNYSVSTPKQSIGEKSSSAASEKLAKAVEKQVDFAAMLGKSMVKNSGDKSFGVSLSNIWQGISELDQNIGKVDNLFENVDSFKDAGGTFDKFGRALMNGKPFVGVIRTSHQDGEYSDISSHLDDRQYAFFDKEGHLYQVLSVQDNGNTVIKDEFKCYNPDSSVAEISTEREVYTRDRIPWQGYEALLEKYNIQ